ncbi:MAG: hypothetical protein JSS27_07105 [Planctomycetes bacterium]|nr:hypothetical protein [Planctomycetota bacterium]
MTRSITGEIRNSNRYRLGVEVGELNFSARRQNKYNRAKVPRDSIAPGFGT